MKKNIHPSKKKIEISCNCGNKFFLETTVSADRLNIEVCNMCHPFYTGKQKIVDTAGRVERFRQKYAKTAA